MKINTLKSQNENYKEEMALKNEEIFELKHEIEMLKGVIEEETLEHYNCIFKKNE